MIMYLSDHIVSCVSSRSLFLPWEAAFGLVILDLDWGSVAFILILFKLYSRGFFHRGSLAISHRFTLAVYTLIDI